MSWKGLSRARRAGRSSAPCCCAGPGRGGDPGAAEAERLPRRQRPGTTRRLQRIRRPDRQAPGAAADLPPLGQQPQRRLRTLARNRDAAGAGDLDRRRPDPGGDHHPGADRARRRRRLPAAAQRLLRHPRAARLHPPARRAEPLPQRLVGGQLRRQPERRRTLDRLVQAGLPPDQRDRPRRADAGRDQRDPGRNRAAAAEPDQGAEPRKPAGGAGEHHLEPAARRLAAGERATSPATTGPAAAGSTGSAPTSTRSIRSGKTSTASTPASSGRASRSRSTSGRSRRSTNRASSNS